ncbi:MAG: hypothetical protein HZC47_04570 [Methanobacterium sp.]|uniref:hypothetical protein n=1 Tax=Methanobacterium sp. TaxID=2164 RepID=UPI003D6481C6|nr:hypothetical protein [Methanobacterium sp.]
MDIYYILAVITFVSILVSIFMTCWTYLTHNKEQMQANMFLRYDYFKKSSLIFFIAIAFYLIMNSLDHIGIVVPTVYMVITDIAVLFLILVSLYYFKTKVTIE